MPQITFQHHIDITPEKFVKACSDVEIQELCLELDRELRRRNIQEENRELKLEEEF